MKQLTNPAEIKSLMERYGFRFSKAMGQNFIINPSVCPQIAEMGGAGRGVAALEIGPGLGVLTAELAKRCDKVVGIELDKRLIPILGETLSGFGNVEIINGDIMQTDIKGLIASRLGGMEMIICANLPYYITSPVIMKLLEEKIKARSITVMVQKETAQRLCAALPSRNAGAITMSVNYYAEPKILFYVSKGSFMPAPEVDSAVIRLDIRESPAIQVSDEVVFFKVIKAAFSQRRKTILNALAAGLSADKAKISEILIKTGISPLSRAEQLTPGDFAQIADAYIILNTNKKH